MLIREFDVTVERFSRREKTSTERETYGDEADVASVVTEVARSLDAVVSGLEDFGEGICVLENPDHECDTGSPVCRENEYEGGYRWIVRRLEELEDGEAEGFHVGGENWAEISVTLRESD
jgi:hypothetical protein